MNLALFGLLSLFWGGSFVAIKQLIETTPSFTAAFYRVFFSILFLLLIYARSLKITKKIWSKELLYSALTGLCSIGIPFSLLFWGEKYISPSVAGVLNGTVPFWTLIISIFLFNGMEQITKLKTLGLLVGFSGIALIFGPKLTLNGGSDEIMGLIAVCGMAFFYALGINLNKQLLSKNKIVVQNINTVVQQVSSLIFLTIIMLIVDGVPNLENLLIKKNFISVIYLSLFSTCIAFIFFYRLIKEMGPIKTSTVTFFIPPMALILDALIYGRQLTFNEGAGAVVILLSMILLKDREKKASKKIALSKASYKLS